MAHLFIVAVNDSFDRKNVNHFQIYYVLDFSFFMSQDDAYYHIHQNDPAVCHFCKDIVVSNTFLIKPSMVVTNVDICVATA